MNAATKDVRKCKVAKRFALTLSASVALSFLAFATVAQEETFSPFVDA